MTRVSASLLLCGLVLTLIVWRTASAADAPFGAVPAGHERAYIGTYNSKTSKGIYVADFDSKTGQLGKPVLAAEAEGASFLAFHPNHKWLYAINEVNTFAGKPAGAVSGYTIEPDGSLKQINQASSVGVGPAHLAIDPSGKWLLVANYGGGSTALLPIGPDGKLGPATAFVEHEATKPQVSHAHYAAFSADGKYAFVCDAGVDKVHQFQVDAEKGQLIPNDPSFVKIGPGRGTGPRHLTFSKDGSHAYVINETNLTMTTLSYDTAHGTFTALKTIATVPDGTPTKGFSTAEVLLHPSGKFVFGSNRGFDSIATFAVDPKTAEITLTAQQHDGIKVPRNFAIDPAGNFLLVGNQDGDSIVGFKIDPDTGKLTPTGEKIELGKPVCIVFMPK